MSLEDTIKELEMRNFEKSIANNLEFIRSNIIINLKLKDEKVEEILVKLKGVKVEDN